VQAVAIKCSGTTFRRDSELSDIFQSVRVRSLGNPFIFSEQAYQTFLSIGA